MAKITFPYNLVNDTPADANPVESNFNRIEQYINQELIERDGSVSMRQALRLAGDPVSALDAAPKQYVDAKVNTAKTDSDAKAKAYTDDLAQTAVAAYGSGVGAPLLFQAGFWNGNTDSNGYARISWPIAFKGIPTVGDIGNIPNCGVVCMQARGSGGVIDVPGNAQYALGGFNAKNAIIRVFNVYLGDTPATPSVYCVFHWLAWGPRP